MLSAMTRATQVRVCLQYMVSIVQVNAEEWLWSYSC